MEFGLTPGGGLGGKGYSEGQADIQYRMGLGPLAQYLKSMIDRFLKLWGYPAQFRWVSLQVREDALRQAQTDQVYINTGVRSRFDVAEEHGWEAPADFTPPGSGLLALTDATGELSKVAQEDDPFLEDKTDLAQRLKEQLIDYWEGLRERVVEVVSDSVAT